MRVRKCQSRKHTTGGCGDPKCPEGLSLARAISVAVDSGEFEEYRKLSYRKLARQVRVVAHGGGYADIHTINGSIIRTPLDRPWLKDAVADVLGKPVGRGFGSVSELNEHLRDLYHPAATAWVASSERDGYIYVDALQTAPEVRGMGLATRIRETITAYADEHDLIVGGTPTTSGNDDTFEPDRETEREEWVVWRKKSDEHRLLLERFYRKHGYVENPYFVSSETVGEPATPIEGLNERGVEFLSRFPFRFVRFSNLVVPAKFRE